AFEMRLKITNIKEMCLHMLVHKVSIPSVIYSQMLEQQPTLQHSLKETLNGFPKFLVLLNMFLLQESKLCLQTLQLKRHVQEVI
ncbi:MAG: hypothetical protein PHY71_09265, partial [Bacteroidaceae bacterium]|nr:hypothetical protein [Bacteroidaceae bacterium]